MPVAKKLSYVQDREADFLQLWPHRYDYIYGLHPGLDDRPQWQTESRHPLSDRLIQQGSYLYGVRFGAQTQYCLLDIDAGSAYHPQHDALAITRIAAALEPLGLVNYLTCTSSYSGGLHLYFPFEEAQNSWQLAIAVTTLLENQGFRCQPGQLEVFPNPKLYVVQGTPNLFNGHRLPLQTGSYLLNAALEPIFSSPETFVQQWRRCQRHNAVAAAEVERILKQTRRRQYPVSNRADKFLNDLNAEIELGWTGKGQTNHLLGRITMRTYIFHHVLRGGQPLHGEALIAEIVAVAKALPGYREWCGHQHEIEQRAAEWARCVENSHYFPYGTQRGKYKTKRQQSHSEAIETTWNEQRSLTAQEKIRAAMSDLLHRDNLPELATARFQQLISYGIGGSTLYKYKELWHPHLWTPPPTPPPSNWEEASATASPATASHPPSLLSGDDRNVLLAEDLSDFGEGIAATGVRNSARPTAWQQLVLSLKQVQSTQKVEARSQKQRHFQLKARENARKQARQMVDYLQSGDPILEKVGLEWVMRQQREVVRSLLSEAFGPGEAAALPAAARAAIAELDVGGAARQCRLE